MPREMSCGRAFAVKMILSACILRSLVEAGHKKATNKRYVDVLVYLYST